MEDRKRRRQAKLRRRELIEIVSMVLIICLVPICVYAGIQKQEIARVDNESDKLRAPITELSLLYASKAIEDTANDLNNIISRGGTTRDNNKTNEGFYLPDCPLDAELQQFIYNKAVENNLPVLMVFTIPDYESGWVADAVSDTNDYGLYQINKCNHSNYAEKCNTANEPLNPYVSSTWATKMLSSYYKQFLNKYNDAARAEAYTLSCYNMGPGDELANGYLKKYYASKEKVSQWFINAGYEEFVY